MNKPAQYLAESDSRASVVASWVEDHGDALFAFALLRTGVRELAEDLVQDTYLSAYAAYDSFEGRSAPRTWLISILKNKIIDHARRTIPEGDGVDPETLQNERGRHFNACGDWIQKQQRWAREPDSVLEERTFFSKIYECIEHLPVRLRTLFVMRTLDDTDTETICKNLSLTTTNLWVGMFRARMKLKECLEKNWYQSGE